MEARKFYHSSVLVKLSCAILFFLMVAGVGYAQNLDNLDTKSLGEAMLKYQKGQIDETAFSKVLHAKVAPTLSASDIKETIKLTQQRVKTQSGKPIEEAAKGTDLKLSKKFYDTAKKMTDLDPSSFKNTEAYFVSINKIIDSAQLDKEGLEYGLLSAATISSKSYMDALNSSGIKITNDSSTNLTTQFAWSSVFKVMGAALNGAISGAGTAAGIGALAGAGVGAAAAGVGAAPGAAIGSVGGLIVGGLIGATSGIVGALGDIITD